TKKSQQAFEVKVGKARLNCGWNIGSNRGTLAVCHGDEPSLARWDCWQCSRDCGQDTVDAARRKVPHGNVLFAIRYDGNVETHVLGKSQKQVREGARRGEAIELARLLPCECNEFGY